jgi:hypothetical protein
MGNACAMSKFSVFKTDKQKKTAFSKLIHVQHALPLIGDVLGMFERNRKGGRVMSVVGVLVQLDQDARYREVEHSRVQLLHLIHHTVRQMASVLEIDRPHDHAQLVVGLTIDHRVILGVFVDAVSDAFVERVDVVVRKEQRRHLVLGNNRLRGVYVAIVLLEKLIRRKIVQCSLIHIRHDLI